MIAAAAWETAILSASPCAMRAVGERALAAAAATTEKLGLGHDDPHWSSFLEALASGDPEAAVRAGRRCAPEFRNPLAKMVAEDGR